MPKHSKYLGVTKHPDGRWLAQIRHENKVHYIGAFENEHQAAAAFDKKAVELRGPGARLNFPGLRKLRERE